MRRAVRFVLLFLLAVAAGLSIRDWLRAKHYDYRPVPAESGLLAGVERSLPVASERPGGEPLRGWLVLCWDGASWKLIRPLLERGLKPNLAALMARGSFGALATFRPTLSPVLWTTVATGRSPAGHGILRFDKPVSPWVKRWQRLTHGGHAPRVLYTNRDRKAAALWELLTRERRRSLIVGYHNTFPAEPIDGVMISNYLVQRHMESLLGAERSGGEEAFVSPPELLDDLLRLLREVEAEFPRRLGEFAEIPQEERARFLGLAARFDKTRDVRPYFLKRAFVFDEFDARAALELLPRVRPRLAMVHFQCLDLASHYFLYFHRPDWFSKMPFSAEERATLEAMRPRYEKTVRSFYVAMDRRLGRFLEAIEEGTAVMVLSDHGFDPEPDASRTGYHEHGPAGILVMAGPGIRKGIRVEGASVYDIFPTLAATLGLPLSQQLPGRVLEEALGQRQRAALPDERLGAYPFDPAWTAQGRLPRELSREIEGQLRSLGYVQ